MTDERETPAKDRIATAESCPSPRQPAEGRFGPRDEKLQGLLRKWEPPVVPDGMDERVMEAYRREAGTAEPFWKRWFSTSIRVPVPVALVVALLLIFTAALALRPVSPPAQAVTPDTAGPVRSAQQAVPVVTGTSLAGFQPVTEITASVVQEGTP